MSGLSGVRREGNAKRVVSHPHVWTDGTLRWGDLRWDRGGGGW